MKKVFFVVFTVTIFMSCEKIDLAGFNETEERTINKSYTVVKASSSIAVEFSKDIQTVIVESDANALAFVETTVSAGVLFLRYDNGASFNGRLSTTVYLPFNPELEGVSLSGSSSFRTSDVIESDDFDLHLSGDSFFSGMIKTEDADLRLSGSSTARISGEIESCDACLSGSSYLYGNYDEKSHFYYDLTINEFDASFSGSSEAYFASDGSISGKLSGDSKIFYTGTASASVSTSGDSSVTNVLP